MPILSSGNHRGRRKAGKRRTRERSQVREKLMPDVEPHEAQLQPSPSSTIHTGATRQERNRTEMTKPYRERSYGEIQRALRATESEDLRTLISLCTGRFCKLSSKPDQPGDTAQYRDVRNISLDAVDELRRRGEYEHEPYKSPRSHIETLGRQAG